MRSKLQLKASRKNGKLSTPNLAEPLPQTLAKTIPPRCMPAHYITP